MSSIYLHDKILYLPPTFFGEPSRDLRDKFILAAKSPPTISGQPMKFSSLLSYITKSPVTSFGQFSSVLRPIPFNHIVPSTLPNLKGSLPSFLSKISKGF